MLGSTTEIPNDSAIVMFRRRGVCWVLPGVLPQKFKIILPLFCFIPGPTSAYCYIRTICSFPGIFQYIVPFLSRSINQNEYKKLSYSLGN